MDDTDDDGRSFRPAQSVLFSSIPSPFPPRRLSSHFTKRTQPVHSARKLAWVSLQGRIVGAEEASSAKAIGGDLSKEESVAWDLFAPMHRILIVAVIAVATAHNREIRRLKQSVQLRDKVLTIMQQKLEDLCEHVLYFKSQPLGGDKDKLLSVKTEGILAEEASECENITATGLKGLGNRRHSFTSVCSTASSHKTALVHNSVMDTENRIHNDDQQEERRLSGLSDWDSSVTSSSDFQLVSLEQDLQNLKQECDEKDVMIQELSQHMKSVDAASSKRIGELEEVIRSKNKTVANLQKDMQVLEQKIMQLTRAKRLSTSNSISCRKVPLMSENVLYDMDSTTGPSSDSDCSRSNKPSVPRKYIHESNECKASESELNYTKMKLPVTDDPLQEISENQKYTCSEKLMNCQSSEAFKNMRRRRGPTPAGFGSGSKNAKSSKRWV